MGPNMRSGLEGKRIAVMAGSEGLGRACAEAFAEGGASVAICARREDRLASTAKELRDGGARVETFLADVGRAGGPERFVDQAAAALGGLDGLLVNAGGPRPGRFDAITDDDWQASFDLTLMSAVRAVRAALPHMQRAGGGSIAAIQSSSVKQPNDDIILSNSMRLAVAGLFKSLANQYGPQHVRFNLILPGGFSTDRLAEVNRAQAGREGISEEEAWARRRSTTPLRRIGRPEELGELAAFLLSDRSAYITGTAIAVDGGLVRSPL